MTIGPGQTGPPDVLGYFFYQRSSRKLTEFHLLSEREQTRQIRGYQRSVNPGATDREARRAITSQRRKGFLTRTGTRATPEQAAATSAYQERAARSRQAAQSLRDITAKGPMKVAVDLNGYGLVVLVSGMSKRERQIVYRHWMAMLH